MSQKNRNLVMIYLACFSVFLYSCHDEELKEQAYQGKVEAVKVRKAALEEMEVNLGTLNYRSRHSVSSLVSGRLEKLYVKEGQHVMKGEVLAVLKNLQLENQKEMCENTLSEAEASLQVAEDNYRNERRSIEKQIKSLEKLKLQIKQQKEQYEYRNHCYLDNLELQQAGGIPDIKIREEKVNLDQIKTSLEIMGKDLEISSIGYRNLDIEKLGYQVPEDENEKNQLLIAVNSTQALNLVKTERARVDNARKNLLNTIQLMEELKIKAEVSGIVGSCNYQTGDYVSENTSCFVLIDVSVLQCVFYVQETEIAKYSLGNQIEVNIPSIDKMFESKISDISPVADPVSGNFCVKTELENHDGRLKPGMFITCSLKKDGKEKYLAVPESAILYTKNSEPSVYVISGSHVFRKKLNVKGKKNGDVFISSGLEGKDVVVNHPSVLLREGDYVEVQ